MITEIASILAAALILGSISSASAAVIHKPVRHYRSHPVTSSATVTHRPVRHVRHYHSHPVTILLYPQVNDVFANF